VDSSERSRSSLTSIGSGAARRSCKAIITNHWAEVSSDMLPPGKLWPWKILATLKRLQAALERQLSEWPRRGGALQREPESDQWG
jgi:hypothetical protein